MAAIGEHSADYERLAKDFADFLWFLPEGFIEADVVSTEITSINRMACILLGFDPAMPPSGLHGPDVLAKGEFERLFAYHLSLIGPSLAAGLPYETNRDAGHARSRDAATRRE